MLLSNRFEYFGPLKCVFSISYLLNGAYLCKVRDRYASIANRRFFFIFDIITIIIYNIISTKNKTIMKKNVQRKPFLIKQFY